MELPVDTLKLFSANHIQNMWFRSTKCELLSLDFRGEMGHPSPPRTVTDVLRVDLLGAAATLACVVLPVLLLRGLVRRCRRRGGGTDAALRGLERAWARFPVVARRDVNNGGGAGRPVLFLTLGVATDRMPTGSHVKIRAAVGAGGTVVQRSYTPTRFHGNECELLLRVYPSPHGVMSRHLHGLRVGDSVEMMGPTGLHRYGTDGPGTFSQGKRRWGPVDHVVMLAGGTGITPMLQIANHALQAAGDATKLHLLAFNSTFSDVMMRDELAALAAGSAGQLELTFCVSKLTAAEKRTYPAWKEQSLRTVGADSLRALSAGTLGSDKCMVCVCGPPGFVKTAQALLGGGVAAEGHVMVW